MSTGVGLWIDHRKAVIVSVSKQEAETTIIVSEVEKQLRRSGDSPLKGSFEAQQVPSDNRQQRAYTGHLNTYYDEIIDSFNDEKSIFIFGPGEAKVELKKRLEKRSLNEHITDIETVDNMTDPQIVAKVKEYFL